MILGVHICVKPNPARDGRNRAPSECQRLTGRGLLFRLDNSGVRPGAQSYRCLSRNTLPEYRTVSGGIESPMCVTAFRHSRLHALIGNDHRALTLNHETL